MKKFRKLTGKRCSHNKGNYEKANEDGGMNATWFPIYGYLQGFTVVTCELVSVFIKAVVNEKD